MILPVQGIVILEVIVQILDISDNNDGDYNQDDDNTQGVFWVDLNVKA